MSDRFDVCHPITAGWEGGWSNHPKDPGGATMYGVTQAVFTAWLKAGGQPVRSVKSITKSEALAIYRANYWKAVGADRLFPGVDLAVYDAAVNSGVSRGRKWLIASAGSNDHSVTVKRICKARLSFVSGLTNWKTFGKGWARRIADIEVKGVAMALAAMGVSAAGIQKAAAAEIAASEKAAKAASSKIKPTATAAGASSAATSASATDLASLDATAIAFFVVITAALVLAAIYFAKRRNDETARAVAYGEFLK